MSAIGILSSAIFQGVQVAQNVFHHKNEFQQLGKDLQAGNLSAAQQDFATLTQGASSASAGNATQDFNTLSQNLQSGNLTGAQQAFSSLQLDLQRSTGHHRHHHHHMNGPRSATAAQSGPVMQDLT